MTSAKHNTLPGFTLIEVLVATAITGVLMTLLVTIIIQLFQVTMQSTSRLAVLGDVSLATQALARDVNSASVAVLSDPHNLTLTQPDPDGGAPRTVTYRVSPPLIERNGQPVARYVTNETVFSVVGAITPTQVTLKIVATLARESAQATVQMSLRPQP
jgi:prepilin-type N-terminal cleavage/methylation domain-containing protein